MLDCTTSECITLNKDVIASILSYAKDLEDMVHNNKDYDSYSQLYNEYNSVFLALQQANKEIEDLKYDLSVNSEADSSILNRQTVT